MMLYLLWLTRAVLTTTAIGGLILISACQPTPPLLDTIKKQGELVAATQVGPTMYYKEHQRPTGFEFELASAFADYLGVELKLKLYSDLGEMLEDLRNGDVHLAAAGLTVTEERSKHLRFSSAYQHVTQELVFSSKRRKPRSIAQVYGKKIVVLANSSHSENLERLQLHYPKLRWEEKHNVTALNLLNMVNDGQADFALLDSNVFQTYREIFPELRSAMSLSDPEPLAWAFSSQQDGSLYTMGELFFNQLNETGQLEELLVHFFGHREFDYVGARTFIAHLDSRLVRYEEKFKQNAKELDMDWRLLAAIAYQESLWNPNAISPTGVRGIMMLTRRTAKEMGVTDRRDPAQSIEGGARYFKKLHQRLPKQIREPHRTWFALAAYNVGYGHLLDARRLAREARLDPNNWFHVREQLPRLQRPEVFEKTRHGYAQAGSQSVVYVRNIRRYYDALVWATESDQHRHTPAPQNLVAMRDGLVH